MATVVVSVEVSFDSRRIQYVQQLSIYCDQSSQYTLVRQTEMVDDGKAGLSYALIRCSTHDLTRLRKLR